MENKIINITSVDHKEFGLEESKAVEITKGLTQILEEKKVLSDLYAEVIMLPIEKENISKFKDLRIKIRDNRTKGIEAWHKANKEFYLRGGQFVDAIKRKEVVENERMENNLQENETYFERLESQRILDLTNERIKELELYAEFVPFGVNLGTLSGEEYTKVFNGSKLQYEAKIEAERKAEAERLEAERLAEIARIEREKEIEAQRIENERLKAEQEAREKEIEAERKKQAEILAQQKAESDAKLKAEQEAREKEIEAERKKQAEILAQQKAESDAKLKAEQEAREKLQAELKAKADAEAKAEKERQEAELKAKKDAEKLAKAPIKKQLEKWVDSFDYEKNNLILQETICNTILLRFQGFKDWAKSEIEKI